MKLFRLSSFLLVYIANCNICTWKLSNFRNTIWQTKTAQNIITWCQIHFDEELLDYVLKRCVLSIFDPVLLQNDEITYEIKYWRLKCCEYQTSENSTLVYWPLVFFKRLQKVSSQSVSTNCMFSVMLKYKYILGKCPIMTPDSL